jgi:hypothetical protein
VGSAHRVGAEGVRRAWPLCTEQLSNTDWFTSVATLPATETQPPAVPAVFPVSRAPLMFSTTRRDASPDRVVIGSPTSAAPPAPMPAALPEAVKLDTVSLVTSLSTCRR